VSGRLLAAMAAAPPVGPRTSVKIRIAFMSRTFIVVAPFARILNSLV
jgi:hypothetical protein